MNGGWSPGLVFELVGSADGVACYGRSSNVQNAIELVLST